MWSVLLLMCSRPTVMDGTGMQTVFRESKAQLQLPVQQLVLVVPCQGRASQLPTFRSWS